jgi:hypothetical protein
MERTPRPMLERRPRVIFSQRKHAESGDMQRASTGRQAA